jgi:hypothetical protein
MFSALTLRLCLALDEPQPWTSFQEPSGPAVGSRVRCQETQSVGIRAAATMISSKVDFVVASERGEVDVMLKGACGCCLWSPKIRLCRTSDPCRCQVPRSDVRRAQRLRTLKAENGSSLMCWPMSSHVI